MSMMVLGALATIGVQSYTAYHNYKETKENAEKIKELQHNYKLEKHKRSIERDKEKFRRSCEFQLQMEEDEHLYKMANTRSKFLESIDNLVLKQELKDYYPLVLSPYIISHSVLPSPVDEASMADFENVREHILCVLTCSNHSLFNGLLISDLDNFLSLNFSRFWNKSSQHKVCYYTNVWKKNRLLSYDTSDWNNLRPLISSPTIFITPLVSSSSDISIRITMMVNGMEFHCEKKLDLKFELTPTSTSDQIRAFKSTFKNSAFSEILCDAAFLVDSHYWNNHKFPPRLPRLLSSKLIQIDHNKEIEYIEAYSEFYRSMVLGMQTPSTEDIASSDLKNIGLLASLNQFNFPQRSIGYLNSLFLLPFEKDSANSLVQDTLLSICNARTLEQASFVEDVHVSQLDKDDMDVITQLANLSRKYNLDTKSPQHIIQNWICSWH